MTKTSWLLPLLLQVVLTACTNSSPRNTTAIINYQLVNNWPSLPKEFKLGNPTGTAIDNNGAIFIFHRAEREWPLVGAMPDTFIASKTILLLDAQSGQLLNSWGDNLFIMPHGLTVDANNNVWVTDVGAHQVFQFDREGKLLMKLGEAKVPGNDSIHFNRPTDVAVAADGSFYVSDGYGNSRIIKFSATGKYLFEWGTKGDKSGQFNIPHAITLDDKGNVYVADRENNRVQVFDATGKFISQWTNKSFGRMCSITYDKMNQQFIAVDDDVSLGGLKHNGSDIIVFDSTGKVLAQFGRSGSYSGPKCWYHDVTTDKGGNIYVEDILGNTIQKFSRSAAK